MPESLGRICLLRAMGNLIDNPQTMQKILLGHILYTPVETAYFKRGA